MSVTVQVQYVKWFSSHQSIAELYIIWMYLLDLAELKLPNDVCNFFLNLKITGLRYKVSRITDLFSISASASICHICPTLI